MIFEVGDWVKFKNPITEYQASRKYQVVKNCGFNLYLICIKGGSKEILVHSDDIEPIKY